MYVDASTVIQRVAPDMFRQPPPRRLLHTPIPRTAAGRCLSPTFLSLPGLRLTVKSAVWVPVRRRAMRPKPVSCHT